MVKLIDKSLETKFAGLLVKSIDFFLETKFVGLIVKAMDLFLDALFHEGPFDSVELCGWSKCPVQERKVKIEEDYSI